MVGHRTGASTGTVRNPRLGHLESEESWHVGNTTVSRALGRRQRDRLTAAADRRRILLVGPDEAWRLLTAYLFEEAGYVVYAAADHWQAVAFTSRLLPDVVVVPIETPNALEILAGLSDDPEHA